MCQWWTSLVVLRAAGDRPSALFDKPFPRERPGWFFDNCIERVDTILHRIVGRRIGQIILVKLIKSAW